MTRQLIPRLCALFALALTGFPKPSAAQVLTIRIRNASSAGQRDLAELKQTATVIFEHSDIKVLWVDNILHDTNSPPAPISAQHPLGTSIGVVVVNDRDQAGCHTLAWTNLGSSIVTINYRRAEKTARASKIDISLGNMLGHLIAHEIGHLLLKSGNHGSIGIMKLTYDDRDLLSMAQGHLFFTKDESRSIRARLLAALGE